MAFPHIGLIMLIRQHIVKKHDSDVSRIAVVTPQCYQGYYNIIMLTSFFRLFLSKALSQKQSELYLTFMGIFLEMGLLFLHCLKTESNKLTTEKRLMHYLSLQSS